MPTTPSDLLRTICSHDCPDACAVLVSVENGKATRFSGDPAHPVTRGFLCGKVGAYEHVVYSPERLLHPMKRVGKKGSAAFERISWREAIATIVGRLQETCERSGGEAILNYYYAGTMGYVQRFCADAIFHRLGATRLNQNICYYGAEAGYSAAVGGGYGVDIEDVVHSDLITVWGANIVTTQVHLVPFVDQARKQGAPLWVVDPYRNRTAALADRWLQVRPGTDAALALGLMHILERDARTDADFIARRTIGYEKLRDDVLPRYSPERVGAITGLSTDDLEEYAQQLVSARAPLFKVGIGLGRNSHGGAGVRAICCLAGVLGAYESLGGGVLYDSGCEFQLNLDLVTRPDWSTAPTRVVNMTNVAYALTDCRDPQIEFLYVHGSNPAATAPLQSQLLAGLSRTDLFTVVHERFLTDTARYADIVLPATTFPEMADLYKSYGHLYLQFATPVIEPCGESWTNLQVAQAIGRELGIDDAWCDKSVEDFVRDIFSATDHPNFEGIDVERILAGEPVRLNVPRGVSGFAERFGTESGKLEFYSAVLAARGEPAVVDYTGDPFNEHPELYPLRLITPPAHSFLNSSFCHGERDRKKEQNEPYCLVHPADAAQIDTGDLVEIFNEHGAVRLRARVTEDTLPGVVVVEGQWWPCFYPNGLGINALTSDRLTDLGGGSTFHDNRVDLKAVR